MGAADTAFDLPARTNMIAYFLEGNLAAGRADRQALICKDRDGNVSTATFGDVCRDVNRVGRVFQDLGVDLEDRVLLGLGDGPEFVASWFAAVKIGAVVAAVNPLLPADDYAYYLEYSRAKVCVCDEDSLPAIASVLPDARHLRALLVAGRSTAETPRGSRASILRWADAVPAASDELSPADTSKDDVAVWLFTSGTTGKPKAAVHFHHDFVYSAEHYAKHVLQLTPEDRTMGVPKLFFGYATGTNLLFPFAVGAAAALFQERSKPEAVLDNLRAFRPTVLCAVPTTINGILALQEDARRDDLSCLRYLTSAGEALPAELYQKWLDTFGVEILDGIGSAENFHVFVSHRIGDARPGTLGKVVPGYEVKIVGPDGGEVADGETGTLWVRGGSTALCYWNARAKSRETFHGDWIKTADQFRKDADGNLVYAGRADDMLKVGGIFVSPLEIESCLLEHPAVRECAVVGYDEAGLVKARAFVVCADGHLPGDGLSQELIQHVKRKLAPYKTPKQIRFLELLPRNDRGKVEKKALRES